MTNPNLTIHLNLPNADVEVNNSIRFTPFEINNMRNGLRYRVTCKLMGNDPVFDDTQYVFPSQTITGNQPALKRIKFKRTINKSRLDEDDSIFDDTDEIFAVVSLINLDILGNPISKNSNEIVHQF